MVIWVGLSAVDRVRFRSNPGRQLWPNCHIYSYLKWHRTPCSTSFHQQIHTSLNNASITAWKILRLHNWKMWKIFQTSTMQTKKQNKTLKNISQISRDWRNRGNGIWNGSKSERYLWQENIPQRDGQAKSYFRSGWSSTYWNRNVITYARQNIGWRVRVWQKSSIKC